VNATGVTAGPAESNGRLLLSKWRDSLHVTCGLTACTPGSALGPMLGNEYGKNFTFYLFTQVSQHQKVKTDFENSFTDRLSDKFATNSYLNIPAHVKYVATLLCEI